MKKTLLTLAISMFMVTVHATEKTNEEKVFDDLNAIFKQKAKIENIQKTDLPGAYYAFVEGNSVIYFPESKYYIVGDLYNGKNQKNISTEYNATQNKSILSTLNKEDSITYTHTTPEKKGELYIFTDPSCPYCEKMHSEMDSYLSKGYDVIYYPYPRFGVDGPGYNSTVLSWCAKDKKKALDLAMHNKKEELNAVDLQGKIEDCRNTISKYQKISERLGVTGTPAVYLETGHQIGGYVPAETVVKYYQLYDGNK